MKRKLKTLKQLVDEFPDLYFTSNASLHSKKWSACMPCKIITMMGKEIEVSQNSTWIDDIYFHVIGEWLEPLPEKEEWFEVFYLKKNHNRPWIAGILYKSKQDFLNFNNSREYDFEWIKLRKVEID